MKKKQVSLMLVMLASTLPVLANETKEISVDYVGEYNDTNSQYYEVEAPAQIAPGDSGEITLRGIYSPTTVIKVTGPEEVVLTNNLSDDIKTLEVTFNDIVQPGKIYEEVSITEELSIEDMEAYFGEWHGVITLNVNIEDHTENNIEVSSKDEQGNDLNATSTPITGTQKEELLNSLVQSGLVESTSEVDYIVDINADEFTDNATVTLTLRGFAKPGDRVAVYHYDESNSTWEEITIQVVDSNYQIQFIIDNFSPFAFINLGLEESGEGGENGHTHNYTSEVTTEATCTTAGVKTFTCECGDAYTEEIPAGHVWDTDFTVDLEATCTEVGSKSIHCARCEEKRDITSIETISHDYKSGICDRCYDCMLAPGLYDENGDILVSWEDSGLDIQQDYESSDYYNVETSGQYIFTKVHKGVRILVVPDTVTKIGNNALRGCANLYNVVLPDSVESIGNLAFSQGSGLKGIKIPDSVLSVGESAFWQCTSLSKVIIGSGVTSFNPRLFRACESLKSVTIPDNVTRIGDEVFKDCYGLESIIVPDSVTSLGKSVFAYCNQLKSVKLSNKLSQLNSDLFYRCNSLTSIEVPAGVWSIDPSALCINHDTYETSNLVAITVAQGNMMFKSVDGVLYSANGEYLIQYPEGRSEPYYQVLPGTKYVNNNAFNKNIHVTQVILPDGLETIGSAVFEKCSNLNSVNLPNTLKSIGEQAFWYCTSISSLNIPNSVTSIGSNAFKNVPHITYNGSAEGSPWGALALN